MQPSRSGKLSSLHNNIGFYLRYSVGCRVPFLYDNENMHLDNMKTGLEFSRKVDTAYMALCKPLCKKWHLTQTALDILMFLANNPEFTTARDIVEIRKLKANLVSVNVDRLVREGYLVRQEVAGDRRKTKLLCTSKADEIITQGRKLQQDFVALLFAGIDEGTRDILLGSMTKMEENLDYILEEEA